MDYVIYTATNYSKAEKCGMCSIVQTYSNSVKEDNKQYVVCNMTEPYIKENFIHNFISIDG